MAAANPDLRTCWIGAADETYFQSWSDIPGFEGTF